MDAVSSWKAYAAATARSGAYGDECATLRAHGMAELVETHFVEAAEVRPSSRPTDLPSRASS